MTTQNETGPVGPRVTMDAIEANILSESYVTGDKLYQPNPSDPYGELSDNVRLMTICMMELRNGFVILGKSACASPEVFDEKIGRQIARQDCINQIWPLMGYELKAKLHAIKEYQR